MTLGQLTSRKNQ